LEFMGAEELGFRGLRSWGLRVKNLGLEGPKVWGL